MRMQTPSRRPRLYFEGDTMNRVICILKDSNVTRVVNLSLILAYCALVLGVGLSHRKATVDLLPKPFQQLPLFCCPFLLLPSNYIRGGVCSFTLE